MAGHVYVSEFAILQPYFKKVSYNFMTYVPVRIYAACVCCLWRPEKCTRIPTTAGDKVTSSCEPPDM